MPENIEKPNFDQEPAKIPEAVPVKENEKISNPCVTYLDFQEPTELIDNVFSEIQSWDSRRQQRLFLKLGLNENEVTPEILRDGLYKRLEAYRQKTAEVEQQRPEVIKSFLKWTDENNIVPNQNIDALQVYIFDNILGYGSSEKILKKGPISQFDLASNAVYLNAEYDLDILSHEYIHAASYRKGAKSMGFRTIDEHGNFGGNQWLDEGCAVIGEHATRLTAPSPKKLELYEEKINVYEKGYLWLTKLFCKKIGWTEIDVMKAHFGQKPYRENLEDTVQKQFGCTIEDLDDLFFGYSDEVRADMEAILGGEETILHTKGNAYLHKKYTKLKKIFKNIIISD